MRVGRSVAGIRRRNPSPDASKWSPSSHHPTRGVFLYCLSCQLWEKRLWQGNYDLQNINITCPTMVSLSSWQSQGRGCLFVVILQVRLVFRWWWRSSWPRIQLGLYLLRRHRLISIGIPIINLRRSSDCLRFIMGISIPVRRRLLSE